MTRNEKQAFRKLIQVMRETGMSQLDLNQPIADLSVEEVVLDAESIIRDIARSVGTTFAFDKEAEVHIVWANNLNRLLDGFVKNRRVHKKELNSL
jgi:hypothetical protein